MGQRIEFVRINRGKGWRKQVHGPTDGRGLLSTEMASVVRERLRAMRERSRRVG